MEVDKTSEPNLITNLLRGDEFNWILSQDSSLYDKGWNKRLSDVGQLMSYPSTPEGKKLQYALEQIIRMKFPITQGLLSTEILRVSPNNKLK